MFKNLFKQCPVDHSLNIEFIPSSQEVADFVDPPMPAKSVIPDWYKSKENFDVDKLEFLGTDVKKPLKLCTPFLDSLTSGYIQNTWSDTIISVDNNNVNYKWILPPQTLEHRTGPVNIPIPPDFHNVEFHWKMPWIIKVPKDYSILITHPFNRLDLPFYTLTGIVDADEFHHIRFGNLPFYVRKNFTGIIPAETPMFQIIPFKRSKWKSSVHAYDQAELLRKEYSFGKKLVGEYKKRFWKKKQYE